MYVCVYFIPGHGRMILKKCQDDPWIVWWGGKQRRVGVLDLEARRPAGWTSNSDTGTSPYETAPNSAPRGISEQKERKISILLLCQYFNMLCTYCFLYSHTDTGP